MRAGESVLIWRCISFLGRGDSEFTVTIISNFLIFEDGLILWQKRLSVIECPVWSKKSSIVTCRIMIPYELIIKRSLWARKFWSSSQDIIENCSLAFQLDQLHAPMETSVRRNAFFLNRCEFTYFVEFRAKDRLHFILFWKGCGTHNALCLWIPSARCLPFSARCLQVSLQVVPRLLPGLGVRWVAHRARRLRSRRGARACECRVGVCGRLCVVCLWAVAAEGIMRWGEGII